MAKRKDSTALFEVINRGKPTPATMHLPEWAQPQVDHPVEQANPIPRAPKTLRQPPGLNGQAEMPASSPAPSMAEYASPGAPQAMREKVLAVVHNRLHLNLGYASCGIAAAILLVLLVASYKLGQASGRNQMAPKSAQVAQATKPDFPQDQLQARLESLPKGWYMVIQSDVATWEDATAIQRYLYKVQGIDTGIRKVDDATFWVVFLDRSFMPDKSSSREQMQEDANKFYNSLVELGKKPDWQLKDRYNFAQAGKNVWHMVK